MAQCVSSDCRASRAHSCVAWMQAFAAPAKTFECSCSPATPTGSAASSCSLRTTEACALTLAQSYSLKNLASRLDSGPKGD